MTKTRPKAATIGQRGKPQPNSEWLTRIDSVCQGKRKGIYHINAIDDVT